MSELKYITIIYICFIINYARSEDKYGIINSKRTINIVDEKFLSISVDPAILLSGVKIRPATQQIATLLSPAYLRLSGPSTAYIDFDADDSRATSRITESTDRLLVTPGSLATVNRWITAANLTPVFALNDWKRVTTEDTDKWDTKQTTEMLEEIAKGDRVWLAECYWQLGYDNSNKTKHQYTEDIKTFREILDAFPVHAEYWKILGSDFTNCIGIDHNNIESMRNELIGMDAIIWERNNLKDDEHFAEQMAKAMVYEIPVWTACPKTSNPISFESAILWAHQIGKAATEGFKVIFRQPRIHEFFTDTPPFWVSYLHKKLMGRNVLDIKTLDDVNANVSVFAHCAKKQNNFPKGGAITILIINNSTEEQRVNIKFSGVLSNSKTTYEVQSFILEAYGEDQSNTMLNGKKLTLNEIENNREFIPKLRRARLNRNLIFDIPRKSIGFYLLPGARLPVCISNEDEEDLILKEIIADQCIQFDEEHDGIQVKPRITERKANLNDLYQMVEKELETDESYYKIQAGLGGKPSLAEKTKELKTKKTIEDDSKFVFDMPKIIEVKSVDQRVQDLKNKIKEKMESKKLKNDSDSTNNEMVNVLKERAISDIEKSNVLSESDLEDFMHGVINLKSRQKRNANHGRRRIPSRTFARIHHGPVNPHNVNQFNRNRNILRRPRRDINMDLLKSKTICTNCNDKLDKSLFKSKKSLFESNGEIQATLRLPGQTSLELLTDSLEEDDDDDDDDEEEKIPSEVFAELAKPTERAPDDISNFFAQNDEAKKTSFTWDDSMLKLKPKVDFSNIFQIPKLKPIVSNKPLFEIKPRTAKIDDDDKYMDEIDSLESLEEDGLNKYHGGFFEQLGDTIALEKSKDIDKRKEYSEHESEMNEEAKNLKEKFDNLLNNKKSTIEDDFYTDDIFRRKREVKEYTEEDVAFYKKLMQSNIKHMREQMARNRLRNGMDNLNTGFPRFFQARGANINQRIKNRDSESKKDKIGDLKIENQKKMLKARLNNRKKLEETRNQGKHVDTLLSKLKAKSKSNKDLVNTNNLRRRKRSIMAKRSQNFDELYEPNVRLENTLHAYEPIVQLKNDFVPERRMSKKYTIEIVDDIDLDKQQKTVPIHTPELKEKFLAKNKRYTTREDEFDMFQDISNIFNVIEKDSTFMKPFLDEESGEYDIVFPTKDEIKLIKNRGLTEIEFLHKTTEKATTENQADKETCTANYPNKKGNLGSTEDLIVPPESENINSNLVEYDELTSTEYINVYIGQEKINEFVITASNTEGGINSSTKETAVTSNIGNIPMDGERNCSKIDMIETVFGQFKNIFDTIASTLKKYVHIFHENGRNKMKNETGIES